MSDNAASLQRSEKFIKMTTAPVEKLVLNLAGPTIAIMLVTSFYNITDTYFVSFLGTSQVAAVGIAFPLKIIIQAIGFFFGQGSGNYISRALGAQNTEDASRMAVTALVTGFSMMSLVAIAGLLLLAPFVQLLGSTETITPFAMDYLFYILLGSPWMIASVILNQQLRFQGNAAIAMVGMLTGTILNVILTPVFIFVFGLGVGGAAMATMICQVISFLILFFYATTRKGSIRIKFLHFSPSVSRYVEMSRGGVPSLIRQGLMSIVTISINHFARPYGDAAIAAISITMRITMFANSMTLGFGQGFQPVCGFNYGAKLYSRVKKAFWFCVRSSCVILFLVALVLIIFAPQIIAFFRDEPDVISIGAMGLRLHALTLPIVALTILVNMITQTMGMAMEASVGAFARQGIFLIPSLIILGPLFGLLGIQIALPFSDLAGLSVIIPILFKVRKTLSVPDGGLVKTDMERIS